jgi:chromate reductase, NAD(P)H dehydrogenase (quinone)
MSSIRPSPTPAAERPDLRVLAVSGSLRAVSSSGAVLDATAHLAPPGVRMDRYDRIGHLPHFNPDVEQVALPPEAATWRAAVGEADALLIASPEYAHGVPGSLKNALDWLVGGPELLGKPVAVINPSAHSTFAHGQLLETLRTMSARVIETASCTLPTRPGPGDASALTRDPVSSALLRDAIAILCAAAAEAAAGAE